MNKWKIILENIALKCGGTVLHGKNITVEILSDRLKKAYFDGKSIRVAEFMMTVSGKDQADILTELSDERNDIRSLPSVMDMSAGEISGKYDNTGIYTYSQKLSVTYYQN